MQTKLAHVCIESHDLAATEAFYRVLGLERRFIFNNLQGELVGFYLAFGNNTFIETPSSGVAQVGAPGVGGRGTVSGGVLEGSNVDLATEFSNLIITQRGYQANARTITAADTLLQEVVNLVR